MKIEILKAPMFHRLVRSDIDSDSKFISLDFEAENGVNYQIQLELGCVQLTIAALAGRLGEILSQNPNFDHEPAQPIEVKTLEVANKRSTGGIALLLNLVGGGTLQLGLPEDFIESFSEGLIQAEATSKPSRH